MQNANEKSTNQPASMAANECPSSSSNNALPRILSGSFGAIITALAVTPLEVVKIRQQASSALSSSEVAKTSPIKETRISSIGSHLFKLDPCPRGCSTTLLNNGLMECVLPKTVVPCLISPGSSTSKLISPGSLFESAPRTSKPTSFVPTVSKLGGTLHTLIHIFETEGWAGLYAGLRPTLVMSVPNTVLYFTAYDEISMKLRQYHVNCILENLKEEGNVSHDRQEPEALRQAYIPLIAGSSARLLASLATAPFELIRTRQASFVRSSNSKVALEVPGMFEEFSFLVRTNGISSLYVGLGPTLWRDVPFSAIYWLCVEHFKNVLSDFDSIGAWGGGVYREHGIKVPPSIEAMHAFVSGAAAGCIAAAITTPFDVVKTRRQMVNQSIQTAPPLAPICKLQGCGINKKYDKSPANGYGRINSGTFGYMQQIIQHEGLSGLWKGNTTRMVKVAPACAIMISCYEFGKRVFGDAM